MTAITQPDVPAAQRDHWRVYHDETTLDKADRLLRRHAVRSTGVTLNVDAYEQPAEAAPVLIFNHGGGGYSRLFVGLALALHARGYTVLVPDQYGQGLSEGKRDDFVLGMFVQNIIDVAQWAAERYAGPLVMAGGSLGGALTYYAAAGGAPVRAIACHNLYDFGTPHDGLAVSRLAPVAGLPVIPELMAAFTRGLAALMPGLPLPYRMLGKFDKMVDERTAPGMFAQWAADPYPIRRIRLRTMASMLSTPPAVPLEANTLPVLVINQTLDEMVDPAVTRRNYDRLGGPKQYAEIAYGHWAMGTAFNEEWASLVDAFFTAVLAAEPHREPIRP